MAGSGWVTRAGYCLACASCVLLSMMCGAHLFLSRAAFARVMEPLYGTAVLKASLGPYFERTGVVALHIIPSLAFSMLLPFQLALGAKIIGHRRSMARHAHAIVGRALVAAGAASALSLPVLLPAVGFAVPQGEAVPALLFGAWFLFALYRARSAVVSPNKNIRSHVTWALRSTAVVIGLALMRPFWVLTTRGVLGSIIMAILSGPDHERRLFVLIFWLSLVLSCAGAEAVIQRYGHHADCTPQNRHPRRQKRAIADAAGHRDIARRVTRSAAVCQAVSQLPDAKSPPPPEPSGPPPPPPPHWLPNTAANRCGGCAASFGVWRLRRRHHCRMCGGIFCASCSRAREALQREILTRTIAAREKPSRRHRVCDDCHALISCGRAPRTRHEATAMRLTREKRMRGWETIS